VRQLGAPVVVAAVLAAWWVLRSRRMPGVTARVVLAVTVVVGLVVAGCLALAVTGAVEGLGGRSVGWAAAVGYGVPGLALGSSVPRLVARYRAYRALEQRSRPAAGVTSRRRR
jgi:membrane associated rhomboid family serine protease